MHGGVIGVTLTSYTSTTVSEVAPHQDVLVEQMSWEQLQQSRGTQDYCTKRKMPAPSVPAWRAAGKKFHQSLQRKLPQHPDPHVQTAGFGTIELEGLSDKDQTNFSDKQRRWALAKK